MAPGSSTSSRSSTDERDLSIDILRDPGVCGEWLSRFCQNSETHETMYYFDAASDDARLEVHRGDKYGPVIAESSQCATTPGAIDFVPPRNARAPSPTHIHHEERSLKTYFVDSKQHRYHWNRWSELVEDDTDTVVAKLVRNKRDSREIGKLVIKAGREFSQDFIDSTVMSALIIQQKGDEAKSYF